VAAPGDDHHVVRADLLVAPGDREDQQEENDRDDDEGEHGDERAEAEERAAAFHQSFLRT
jgi:hypothetical protein